MYTLHYSPGACSIIVHVLLEVLGHVYVRTARAKGLTERRITSSQLSSG